MLALGPGPRLVVIGLLWALLAGLLAGPGGFCRLLVLLVLGRFSLFLAEGAADDVVGGGTADVAAGFRFGRGLGCGAGVLADASL